jgi:acetolactate synthase-1/2/3 large subunit
VANACVAEADLVLVVGSKLSPSDTAWENRALLDPTRQIFVQIDIEPRNASWNYPAEHVLIGDAAIVLDQLHQAVGRRGETRRQQAVQRSPPTVNDTAISTTAPILPTTSRSCQRVIGERGAACLRRHRHQ